MNAESQETALQKSETLFGGRTVSVQHEDGTTEDVKVRQLRLADYEDAYKRSEDEFEFTSFCCSATGSEAPLTKVWALSLQPQSYERLQIAAQEVNAAGFFQFASRKKDREQQAERRANERLAEMIVLLPSEKIAQALELGAGRASTSRTPSPKPPARLQ